MPKVKINVKSRIDDTTMDLSLSELIDVPVSEIAKYKRATNLDLSSNKIITLRDNFCTLKHLTKLDLSKNDLKVLPDNFGYLINLKHLDLYSNKLEELPLSFGNLKKLRYLDLKQNPLKQIIADVVGPCITSNDCSDAAKNIIPFYKELEKKYNERRQQEIQNDIKLKEAAKREAAATAAANDLKKKENKKKKQESRSTKVDNLFNNITADHDYIGGENAYDYLDTEYNKKPITLESAKDTSEFLKYMLIVSFFVMIFSIYVKTVYGISARTIIKRFTDLIPENYKIYYEEITYDVNNYFSQQFDHIIINIKTFINNLLS